MKLGHIFRNYFHINTRTLPEDQRMHNLKHDGKRVFFFIKITRSDETRHFPNRSDTNRPVQAEKKILDLESGGIVLTHFALSGSFLAISEHSF